MVYILKECDNSSVAQRSGSVMAKCREYVGLNLLILPELQLGVSAADRFSVTVLTVCELASRVSLRSSR